MVAAVIASEVRNTIEHINIKNHGYFADIAWLYGPDCCFYIVVILIKDHVNSASISAVDLTTLKMATLDIRMDSGTPIPKEM